MSSSSNSSYCIGYYPISNTNQFITSGDVNNKVSGLISTNSADLRYIKRTESGQFYPSSNPNKYINSNPTGTLLYLSGLISTGNADLRYVQKLDYLSYTKAQSGILNVSTNNQTIFYTLESGSTRYIVFSYKNNFGIQFNAFLQLNSGNMPKEDWGLITSNSF
jgi:hypothetical protein